MTRWRPAAPTRPPRVVVERAAHHLGHRLAVARGHEEARLAVGARNLGQRAAGGGEQRNARGHRLDRGQRETFVERGHDGEIALAVELDDALVGHTVHERHDVGEAVLSDDLRRATLGCAACR